MPAPIKELDLSDVQDADLVFLAGQSWYLSPSQPIEAFLTSPQVRTYLKNRPVVTINGCRNMWAMAQKEVRKQLASMEARYVGHIVLQDYAPNLISVVTIFRWLFRQQKAATRIWPAAGVSDADMAGASRFGKLIQSALEQNDLEQLQSALVAAGSVPYKPSLVFVEKTGHRIFGFWAKFIRKAGDRNSPDRRFRLRLFVYYLFFVLYVVSPFGLLFFYLTYPLRMAGIRKEKADLLLNLKE
jgi:hypothetical protein